MEKRKKQGEFWVKEFQREIPVLDLPHDYKRPPQRSFEGGIVELAIDEELGGKLNKMIRQTGATLYMILLAAYYILLSKYTWQENIIVGSPVTGRNHPDLENVMGMFVNMMALRNRPEAGKIFKHFLKEVKEKVLDAVENQDYHFAELVVELGCQGSANRNPLFDVVFSMAVPDSQITGKDSPNDYNQLNMIPYEFDYNIIPFDLIMGAGERNGKIVMYLAYSTDLFKRSTVEKMAGHYMDILTQVTDNYDIRLRDISISQNLITVDSHIGEEDLEEFEF
jgi:non-ribosomal peptide synthetase component F